MAGPTPPLDLPFTPTSASWLNADETFFAKLTRGRLIRGVFRSVGDLKAATRSDSTVPRMNEAGVPAVTIAREQRHAKSTRPQLAERRACGDPCARSCG
jgi:hypothetical protein